MFEIGHAPLSQAPFFTFTTAFTGVRPGVDLSCEILNERLHLLNLPCLINQERIPTLDGLPMLGQLSFQGPNGLFLPL